MPAYKPRFIAQALESVAAQTYRPLELVVCDDSLDARIEQQVAAFAARVDFPVRYSRNPERLWETRSTARGIALAQGEFIKFLHDDDVLDADCIDAMVAAMAAAPEIALVASRRRLIDEAGRPLADELATSFPARDDLRVDGNDLVSFLADHTVNFIGEPSAVLCRRGALLPFGEQLGVLDGVRITWVADLALYVKLLKDATLAMLARPRVSFRISREQFSQVGRDKPGIGERGHDDLRQAIVSLGWHAGEGHDTGIVRMAPLQGGDFQPIDLPAALQQALQVSQSRWQLHDWQARRTLPTAQIPLLQARLDVQGPPRLGVLICGADPAARARTRASLDSSAPLYAGVSVREVEGAALDPDALAAWEADWILRVDAGTTFRAAGRMALCVALMDAGDAPALYVDGWLRQGTEDPLPALRPDLDKDLLLHHPALMARHWVFRREVLRAAGGYGDGVLPELAPVLSMLRDGSAAQARHFPEPVLEYEAPSPDDAAWAAAIGDYLQRTGQPARLEATAPGRYRIEYLHAHTPRVSIVLVAGDRLPQLQRCVMSMLEKTAYNDYELILLDNASADAEARAWLDQVGALGDARLRVFALAEAVPPAQARNLAASQATGELLLFVDDALAALEPGWLGELVQHALRGDVGAVGARTVAADGRITHGGVLPGVWPGGGRAFLGEAMASPGYLGRLQVAQGYSAVAGHCLMLRRELFESLGGFDADTFGDAGADIDLCLRLRARGLRNIWTPHALLLHADVPAALEGEARDALLTRWLPQLAHDPAHHPALRLDQPGGFRLDESDFSWQPLPWRPLPKVLAHPADAAGSGEYRVMQPLAALRAAGLADGAYHARLLDAIEMTRLDPDVVVWQRQVGQAQLDVMARVGRFHRALKIYELDDYLPNLPLKSVHRAQLPPDIVKSLRRAFARVDRLVVSTPALAEALAGMHPDIRIAANRLPPAMWRSLPGPRRNTGPRPRVGWAGGVSHAGDLEMIADVVRSLADEVDWVFMGLCPDALQPYVREFHPGVGMDRYPRVLARLDLDLAIAPLEDNRFNACKSNLRLLEYGACAIPVVASDIEPYRGDLPVTRVRNRHRDWVAAIREQLADADARAAAGDALRAAVWQDWMLAGAGLDDWRGAWLP
ncbi:glycosyltransferase [Stenotrophomonas sp. HITSZ_GD]|uniref:glycosyltransferase n=1 Tax=Stenotrophomonas sp. HITSZ_GD TaxID=3037248 RepID=UPI00240DA552|nr:glycosyltransferase [Stenotrophomonas sp. HITSZ_GD]MDG2526524.1 glycosyltransferase [Stenotrophomonas sp. HITSZ_GD]